ncbi:hypothetical protein BDQ17DRAFT_1428703 [Cyathus striatus]|nr:hypothetical protein BDQ17DRAFT_1428703 [Cyathus striatus]
MPSFLHHLLHYTFTFITPYNNMKSAMEDSAQVESVVKKFSAQHAICLMIFCALFTYKLAYTNMHSSKLTTGPILL